MSFFGAAQYKSQLKWNDLSRLSQLDEIDVLSNEKPVLLYKHSTRCHICSISKNRLELYWQPELGIEPYFLDLIAHRDVSDEIARRYDVRHESPQVLLIKNGKCVYHASHGDIDFNKIKTQL
jgi:bacillithiol system protein YtxJ